MHWRAPKELLKWGLRSEDKVLKLGVRQKEQLAVVVTVLVMLRMTVERTIQVQRGQHRLRKTYAGRLRGRLVTQSARSECYVVEGGVEGVGVEGKGRRRLGMGWEVACGRRRRRRTTRRHVQLPTR
jgi:hypothetical protein